jgi:hypothetical protein
MNRSESIATFAGALAKAQAEMQNAAKDAANPHFKSRYADLASIWDACRAALTKHGLCVVQTPATEGTKVSIITTIFHASGEWISSELATQAADAKPQSIGSALTYLRRYALAAMAGVAPEESDDDGEAAQGRNGGYSRAAQQPRPASSVEQQLSISQQLIAAKTRDEMTAVYERAKDELDDETWERFKRDHAKKYDELRAAAQSKLRGEKLNGGTANPADDGRA